MQEGLQWSQRQPRYSYRYMTKCTSLYLYHKEYFVPNLSAFHIIYTIGILISVHLYIYIDVTANDTAAEGTVRLVGGASPLEGRVEVFLFGQWGTVCSSSWELIDARVVCLELGYLRAVKVPASVSAIYGTGSGPSWYNNVRCTGTEKNLTECSKYFSLTGSACSHTQNAGAVCSSESYKNY